MDAMPRTCIASCLRSIQYPIRLCRRTILFCLTLRDLGVSFPEDTPVALCSLNIEKGVALTCDITVRLKRTSRACTQAAQHRPVPTERPRKQMLFPWVISQLRGLSWTRSPRVLLLSAGTPHQRHLLPLQLFKRH